EAMATRSSRFSPHCIWFKMWSRSATGNGRAETVPAKSRKALPVGIRPAEGCGCERYPSSARSAMTLRIVAGLSERLRKRESVRDPTGSPVSMYARTIECRIACSRVDNSFAGNCLLKNSLTSLLTILLCIDPGQQPESRAGTGLRLFSRIAYTYTYVLYCAIKDPYQGSAH